MKNKMTKVLALMMAGSLGVIGLMGCGAQPGTQTSAGDATANIGGADMTDAAGGESGGTTSEAYADLSGTLTLAGSTSMEKMCEALMEGFMEAYPFVTVTTEYTGSSAGLESLNAGSVQIGNASRNLKEEELSNGAIENIVALDGIAVITDAANTVGELTTEQLAGIYTGEYTNWSELGGMDEVIVVIGRENGSGTRSAFEEIVDIEDACAYAQELDSTGGVLAKVSSTPGAIGYVSLDVVDDSVRSVNLNGAEATEENIINGSYPLARPFVMATKGFVEEQTPLVQAWFSYISSEEGKEIIQSVGLILPE